MHNNTRYIFHKINVTLPLQKYVTEVITLCMLAQIFLSVFQIFHVVVRSFFCCCFITLNSKIRTFYLNVSTLCYTRTKIIYLTTGVNVKRFFFISKSQLLLFYTYLQEKQITFVEAELKKQNACTPGQIERQSNAKRSRKPLLTFQKCAGHSSPYCICLILLGT